MWFIGLFASAVFFVISVIVCACENRKMHNTMSKLDPKNTPPKYTDDVLSYKKDLNISIHHFETKQMYANTINNLLRFFDVGQQIRVPKPEYSGVALNDSDFEYYIIRFFQNSSGRFFKYTPYSERKDASWITNNINEVRYTPAHHSINCSGCDCRKLNMYRENLRVTLIITACKNDKYLPRDSLIEFKDKPRPGIDKTFYVSNFYTSNVQSNMEVLENGQYVNVLEYIKNKIDIALQLNDKAVSEGFDMSETLNVRLIDDYTKYHKR